MFTRKTVKKKREKARKEIPHNLTFKTTGSHLCLSLYPLRCRS